MHAGQPRFEAEATIRSGFEIVEANEATLSFESRLDLPRECRCYPVMINFGTVEFRAGRVTRVESDDTPAWPLLSDMLRRGQR